MGLAFWGAIAPLGNAILIGMTLAQSLRLHNRSHRPLPRQPVTHGVPWPRGAVRDLAQLRAIDAQGLPIPAAFTTLNTWPDGSLQWTLLDTSVDFAPSGDAHLTIHADDEPSRRAAASRVENAVRVAEDGSTVRVGNGLVDLTLTTRAPALVEAWTVRGKAFLEKDGLDVTFRTGEDTAYSLKSGPRRITIEHANPLRAVIRIDGRHGKSGAHDSTGFLDYFLRFEVRAGRDDVKITYAFRNRELPTPGITIHALRATARTTVAPGAKRCFTANTLTRHYLDQSLRVEEDPRIVASDTGDIEHYATAHKDRGVSDCFVLNPEVLHDPPEAKPWWLRDVKFRLVAGGSKCVWPYLAILDTARGGAMASIQGMTCTHPKELTVSGSVFELAFYPEWAGPLDITQGAGRSQVFHLAPVPADATDLDLQNRYLSWEFGGVHTHIPSGSPIEYHPDLDHIRRCKVFAIHMLPAFEPIQRFAFERKVMDAWIGVSYGQLGAVDQVQAWPTAGFWHYGDNGLGNNEEMHNLVYFQNYLRTGNYGCFEYAMAGTTHMLEVDHVAFSTDHLQNGGQVAHTVNHNHGTAYPSHEWFTEYLFAYALTGDREWLERVSYPFWHAFRASRWPLGWVHAMYFIHLAFENHLISDRDVHVQ